MQYYSKREDVLRIAKELNEKLGKKVYPGIFPTIECLNFYYKKDPGNIDQGPIIIQIKYSENEFLQIYTDYKDRSITYGDLMDALEEIGGIISQMITSNGSKIGLPLALYDDSKDEVKVPCPNYIWDFANKEAAAKELKKGTYFSDGIAENLQFIEDPELNYDKTLEDIICLATRLPKTFYTKICNALSIHDQELIIRNLVGKDCFNCRNQSCEYLNLGDPRLDSSCEECQSWYNKEIIGKSRILAKNSAKELGQ